MHYLTQHYKNRCIKLQEQIDALSYYLGYLTEASGMGASPAEEVMGGGTNRYDGYGLANILSNWENLKNPQATLDAYLAAWRAQSSGGGGPGAEGLSDSQFSSAPSFRSASAGRSVAAAARDIMSAGNVGSSGKSSGRGVMAKPSAAGFGPAGAFGYNANVAGQADNAFGGGGGGLAGDFNGDGRVDGADLGLALGGAGNFQTVLQNWTGPGNTPTPSVAGPMSVPTSGRRRRG